MDLSKTPHLPKERRQAFQTLYDKRLLGEYETISGKGSTLMATRSLRRSLQWFIEIGMFKTMLDVGCGDFHWLSHMDLSAIEYTGIDIVPDIIEGNAVYAQKNICFRHEDICETLPSAYDLVLCRDLFTHFAAHDIVDAFNHIKRSGSRYFAASTYTSYGLKPASKNYYEHYTNTAIAPGEWHPTDFEKAPYSFRTPLFTIPDSDPGKTLQFWELDDLPYLGAHTLISSAASNPATVEDFKEHRFFRDLCALPYIERITLFGSRAAGTHRPDSDIDLMLHCDATIRKQEWLDIIAIIDNAGIALPIECYRFEPNLEGLLDTWKNHMLILYQR